MKRSRDERHSKTDPRVPAPKRPKSIQACASCRKNKTRCEQLNGDLSLLRCHRCNVLNTTCSFETSPPNSIPSPSPVPLPPTRDPEFVPLNKPHLEDPASQSVPLFPSPRVPVGELVQKADPPGPWSVLRVPGGLDWTANPMLALQELVRRPDRESVSKVSPVLTVLNREQTKCLLDAFDSRYGPWINLPPSRDGDTPLYDLARCSVASRHLDTTTRSILEPRLKDVARDALGNQMFSPIPTIDSIYAILIYSLWSEIDTVDARLLVGSAVSMAMNLRLGLASETAISLQKEQKREQRLSNKMLQELTEATKQARLWISLANAESMLCIGTGRTPLSRRSSADRNILDIHSPSSVTHGRDMRLGLTSQLLDLTERGVAIRLASYSDLDKWHKEVLAVLVQMDTLHRIITPLPVVAEDHSFYFHMLLVYYFSCRLLVIHQALREARRVLSACFSGTAWHTHFVLNGVNIAAAWGHEALASAESVLVTVISRSELVLIGTAPDIVYAFVSFAAIFLIMAKFAMFEIHAQRLAGSSDILLVKTIDRLSAAAHTPDHCPAKCSRMIASSLATCEKRMAQFNDDDEESLADNVPVAPLKEIAPTELLINLFGADATQDFNRLMNSDVFLDTEFWASFMNNLSSPNEDFSPQSA